MKALRTAPAGIVRLAISQMLIAATVFISLPVHSFGQQNADLQAAGPKILLSKRTNAKVNKMSEETFSDSVATATATKSGIVTAAAATGTSVTYNVLNVEFKSFIGRRAMFTDLKESKLPGVTVLTVIDRFAEVFVSTDAAWNALAANPSVLRVERATQVQAPPPPTGAPCTLCSEAVPESIVRGGYKSLTGKNVIIAVLDTGIDFRHPDFIMYDAAGLPSSRIAYLWDTATEFQPGRGTVAPFKFPNGTSIGTLYTRAQLTTELRSTSVNIPPTDLDGHGTACASVAAGNGNADRRATNGLKRTEVVGVAPEADIIGVRLGRDGLENSYLLNAISEWLEKAAGATPLVISGSFGGHYSGHDGQTIEERELATRFPLTKVGRAVVFAAGNEGNDPIHAKVNFSATKKLVSWTAKEKTLIKIYFDSADPNIGIYGTQATPLTSGFKQEVNPITRQLEVRITVEPGLGGIWFENSGGKPSEAHLYLMDRDYGAFSPEFVSHDYLVGSPGAMENAITVGSYDWNDNFHIDGKPMNLSSVCRDASGNRMRFEIGWLSCYSSPGPARNGIVKPEIAAPGEWFPSANARNNGRSAGTWAMADTTGFYRAMNGTSAATPYTSGVVALMFQKKPSLMLGDVKTLLKGKASKTGLSPFSTGIPNSNWGYGKLDAAAMDRIFAAL